MSNVIIFSQFKLSTKGFSCTVQSSLRNMQADELEFELEVSEHEQLKHNTDIDAIGCVLSTIAGKAYAEVRADIAISRECKRSLEAFTSATWITPQMSFWNKLKYHIRKILIPIRKCFSFAPPIMLNFSGGFDSLAAYAVMPRKKTKLVAVDFGGWFQRETDYFIDFRPNILHTNFRKLKYDRESWTFMGVGTLLFSRPLNTHLFAFGSILEAAAFNLADPENEAPSTKIAPFSFIGLQAIDWVKGLTEVGTAMLVTHYFPDEVTKSLASLAGVTSEKRFRKQVLTEIVCRRFNRNISLPERSQPKADQVMPFGKSFALDFLALYELKHVGADVVAQTVSDIPEEALQLVRELSLDFYEKLNPWFIHSIPRRYRKEYMRKLNDAQIELYNDTDWEEFRQVRAYLATLGYKVL